MMIDNSVFALTDEELVLYNQWANRIATEMGNAEMESWTLQVTFSFSSFGTKIVAHCGVYNNKTNLVIRDDMDSW